ncbi:hypothetical protein BC332_08942 [Capsicum chinense]|nr:hypothetical protein BC332_08942 [Capsicum chinense]
MDLDPDYNPSFKAKIHTKWVATVASIWIQCTSGSLYTFAIYSTVLKSSQGYNQSSLDIVSVFKDIGANVGTLSGVLYSSVTDPRRRNCGGGPWVVLFAGALQCFAGYFLMWLTIVGVLPKPPLLVMCLYMLLAAHAMTFFNTANVVTAVHNFPNYRGTVVGIMKGFLGLSGAILIQVYQTIFRNKPTAYLMLLALLPPITTLLLMSFVTISQTNEDDEKKHLNGFSLIALVLASYLMAVIIVGNIFSLQMSVRIIAFGILIFLLLSPISVAISAHKEKSYRIIKYLLEKNTPEDEQNRSQAHFVDIGQSHDYYAELPAGADQERDMNERRTPEWGENMNLFQAMCTTGFWFLFVTTACGMGTGLATVNNISQIGGSLGYKTLETNTLVSLWSIWNFVGRFGAGYISDYFLRSLGWSRPLFIVVTLACMTVGHAVIASGLPGALYAGSVIVGVCYGSQWSLMPTIASEIFGAGHLGTIFNTITIAGPVGSYILSVWVVGYLYDKEASEENMCSGTHCFMLSFFIMAASTLFGAFVALALFFRTRNFYNNVVHRRGASTITG